MSTLNRMAPDAYVRQQAIVSALQHAREMSTNSNEIRMRNFNFFVVFMAALFAGFAKQNTYWWNLLIEASGIITSLLFLALDIRGSDLMIYNRRKTEILEPCLWEQAGLSGWQPTPPYTRSRLLSHRMLYRLFIVLMGVVWSATLLFSLCTLHTPWN